MTWVLLVHRRQNSLIYIFVNKSIISRKSAVEELRFVAGHFLRSWVPSRFENPLRRAEEKLQPKRRRRRRLGATAAATAAGFLVQRRRWISLFYIKLKKVLTNISRLLFGCQPPQAESHRWTAHRKQSFWPSWRPSMETRLTGAKNNLF